MKVLSDFIIEKDDYDNFIVVSAISGNKSIVKPTTSSNQDDVLLWTLLNDLFNEGHLSNSI